MDLSRGSLEEASEVDRLLDPSQDAEEFEHRNSHGLARILEKSRDWLRSKSFLASLVSLVLLSSLIITYFATRHRNLDNLPKFGQPWTLARLPDSLIPQEYRLAITTFLEPNFTFSGHVDIDLDVLKDTSIIVFHSLELNLTNIQVKTDEVSIPSSIVSNDDNEMTTLHFKNKFKHGEKLILSIDFVGDIQPDLMGYYRSVYHDDEGKPRYLASTQFESTDARRAFPCFDEPALKARFLVNSTVKEPFKALGNMPVEKVIDTRVHGEPGWKTYVFTATPRMCTYLVAWVTSDFEAVTAFTKRGTQVSVWTQPGKTQLGRYALQVGVLCLEYYEALYEIDYPLPKLDQIAIPDFASGAMENWGLVTYRDTALLFDPDLSSALNRQRVAEVVAHELAHQWTGNLVSMKFWNDLWLNEGFAENIEYIGAEAAARADGEDWRMQDQFYSIDLSVALEADASIFTHPITADVEDPAEIEDIFDEISYSKGASLIRMLRAWVNSVNSQTQGHHKQPKPHIPDRDWFFGRMTNYLNAHKYDNAETKDLWNAMDDFDPKGTPRIGVAETMSRWTDQPGYPVVIMKPDGKSLHLRQERFLYNHYLGTDEVKEMETNQTWWIPFTYMVYTNDTEDGLPAEYEGPFTVLMTERETIIPNVKHGFCNPKRPNAYYFIKANVNQSAPYRVLYPEQDLSVVADWVGERFFLPPVGRAGLVSDCINMVISGRFENVEPILKLIDQLLRPLMAEDEYVVWVTVMDLLNRVFLHGAYEIHPSYGDVVKWMRMLVRPAVELIGWDHVPEEAYLRRLLRTELLRFAVNIGEEATVSTAKQLFRDIRLGKIEVYELHSRDRKYGMDEDTKLPIGPHGKPVLAPDILDTVYNAEMISGGDLASYETLLAMWRNATFAVEKNRLLHALCNAKPLWLVRKNLDFIFSPEVRLQDTFSALTWTTSSSYAANQEAWTYFRDHWDELHVILRASLGQRFADVIKVIASTMGSEPLLHDMEKWFSAQLGKCAPHSQDPDCTRKLPLMGGLNVRKGSEIARMRMFFVNTFGDDIGRWMKSNTQ